MHSAMSLLWTPFGPSGTKLSVGSFFFFFPVSQFMPSKTFRRNFFLHMWNSCAGRDAQEGKKQDPWFSFQNAVFALRVLNMILSYSHPSV